MDWVNVIGFIGLFAIGFGIYRNWRLDRNYEVERDAALARKAEILRSRLDRM